VGVRRTRRSVAVRVGSRSRLGRGAGRRGVRSCGGLPSVSQCGGSGRRVASAWRVGRVSVGVAECVGTAVAVRVRCASDSRQRAVRLASRSAAGSGGTPWRWRSVWSCRRCRSGGGSGRRVASRCVLVGVSVGGAEWRGTAVAVRVRCASDSAAAWPSGLASRSRWSRWGRRGGGGWCPVVVDVGVGLWVAWAWGRPCGAVAVAVAGAGWG